MDGILNNFFPKTDKLKDYSNQELKKHFLLASDELGKIEKEKKEFRKKAVDCKEDFRDILDKYDSFEIRKKKSYTRLKREIWQVFENNIYKVQQQTNEMENY